MRILLMTFALPALLCAQVYRVQKGAVMKPFHFAFWCLWLAVSGGSAAMPEWRQAMSSENTVYAIGELSSVLQSRIQWPGGVDPMTFGSGAATLEYGGSDNNAWYMMAGYGSSIYVPELGSYGSMVFTGTGEHALSEAQNIFALSLDNPTWNFFQHPQYSTSLSEAIANNADAYFNVADYNACVSAGRYITYGNPDRVNWDRTTFPVGFGNGWVLRQKYGTNGGTLIGKNVPHWGRYNMPCYIPPSMTGTGVGVILTNSQGTIYGPFNSGSIPPGESTTTFYSEVWPGGARKNWLHAMNVQTRQWMRIATPVPENTVNYGVAMPHAGVDVERKRVCYTANSKIYYADFSNGLAGVMFTVSNVAEPVTSDNLPGYTGALCIVTSGPNAGKRLWYFQYVNDPTNQLVLLDVDALTIRRLSVRNLPASARTISYDATNNLVYMVGASAGGTISCCRFEIPTSYTSAAAYSIEQLPINMNGNSISGGYQLAYQGQGSMLLPMLGTIMVPQRYGKMLAFRPSQPVLSGKVGRQHCMPARFSLDKGCPNPFNSVTNISFHLSSQARVSLKVMDALGKEVATLVTGEKPAGSYSVRWNAKDLPVGLYFCRLQAGLSVQTEKLLIIR